MIKIILFKIFLIWGIAFGIQPLLEKYLSLGFILPICFILGLLCCFLTLNILEKGIIE